MKSYLELKSVFKDRKIVEKNVIDVYDDIADQLTIKLLKGLNLD